ncbi:uncharacterized protein LOC130418841 [Triplophysa dalaica]|uniref:uncharacterized protein LOC130418841 n=1 Tax=Triplophysa dalaica TaxID=1582913 RepID=UPI0024E02C03|nr:uncharacterized protein LOC130418841 [Triplophysa dalaica]
MKTELESMGLWPGSPPVSNPMKTVSLWRLPPQPELIDTVSDLPSAKYFQLHPFFIWKPENDTLMARLKSNYALPCIAGCSKAQVTCAGVGRPRVIVGITGQYYLFSSRLCCKVCKKRWYADNPQWLEKLPKRFTNVLPAILTYKKAICRSVMDELQRTGKSPSDMARQVIEMMHLKFERADFAYLLSCQNVLDSEAGKYGQKTITGFLRNETKPAPFGEYDDPDGWNGISVSADYLTDCLLYEYQRQQVAIRKLLQGTFGQALRSDHTRKVARKVTFTSGTMSSYATMNENWMILSWVMVQSETERSLEPMYQGLANRYNIAGVEKARDCCAAFRVPDLQAGEHLNWNAWRTADADIAEATSGELQNACASRSRFNQHINVKLDLFHCMRRFHRDCVSEHHALYSSFTQFLSAAFCVVDQEDLMKLKNAYAFCGIQPANPTKQHIREHCRTKIPGSQELLKRIEGVTQHFHLAADPNGVHLYKPSMLKTWRIQRVHILRGCLSDPEVAGEILYRHGGTLQLNHVQGEGAKVDVWVPIRGTSQQEGYHFHQAQWVTGTRVSSELFQAQGMMGVARWNFQRLVDLKSPGVRLPGVFDPSLIADLNTTSERVFGMPKYPALLVSSKDSGERFGLDYVEPGCRPVVLDWEKHKSKTDLPLDLPEQSRPSTARAGYLSSDLDPHPESGSITTLPAPLLSSCHGADVDLQPKPESADTLPVSLFHRACTEPQSEPGTTHVPPLPMVSSPASARTGPVKTGGRVFVLDHKRWTTAMKEAIDNLLTEHHGKKDMLKLVDQEYAAMVHNSSTDPNSMLHPTTKLHIAQYVKHLAKLLNTSSSLNTSPEKLLQTQRLWHSLTEGSETTSVPVVKINPAVVNPPALALTTPLSHATIERIVEGIMEKHQQQQQQQQPEQKKKQMKTCAACRQPKSRYESDGSSIHFFYQQGPVRYFYCSTKVFKAYSGEGLTNPIMPFKDFMETEFFQRELDTKKRVEEKGQQKRKFLNLRM